ncbi:MAG: hypothetical protein NC084_06545 [Bacteroides sp.]|nr:hypothetical protein [Bacteroides sp.]
MFYPIDFLEKARKRDGSKNRTATARLRACHKKRDRRAEYKSKPDTDRL